MNFFRLFLSKKFMKICPKTHQIAPFKKIFREACPQTPLANVSWGGMPQTPLVYNGSQVATCRFAAYVYPKSQKVYSCPHPRNPAYAPASPSGHKQ